MKVLVTGFDPFGEDTINPSYEAVKLLPDSFGDVEIIKKEIPTSKNNAFFSIEPLLSDVDVVILVGQAGGREGISIERVGINVDDFRIPDNDGVQICNQPIDEEGENAYFSNLPIYAIEEALQNENIPAHISNTAGTFICNHVLYQSLKWIFDHQKKMLCGFIHVPYLPSQTKDKPSMELEDIVKALEIIIQTSIDPN